MICGCMSGIIRESLAEFLGKEATEGAVAWWRRGAPGIRMSESGRSPLRSGPLAAAAAEAAGLVGSAW